MCISSQEIDFFIKHSANEWVVVRLHTHNERCPRSHLQQHHSYTRKCKGRQALINPKHTHSKEYAILSSRWSDSDERSLPFGRDDTLRGLRSAVGRRYPSHPSHPSYLSHPSNHYIKKRALVLTKARSRKSGDDLLSHKAASERSEESRFVDAGSS